MSWSRASHLVHVSASLPGGSIPVAIRTVRSRNGGWHEFAGCCCFRGLSETGAGLRADNGANPLPDAGPSLAAADLCLAELRPVSKIPCSAGFPFLLAGEAGRAALCSHGGAFQVDQASRATRRRRCIPAALSGTSSAVFTREGG